MRFFVLFLVFLLLVSSVGAFKEETVLGTIVGVDVGHDFGDAQITVSPENAVNRFGNFEQTITVTNKGTVDLYYWVDTYYDENMKSINVYDITTYTVSRPNFETTCTTQVQANGSYVEKCSNIQTDNVLETLTEYTKLSDGVLKDWGNSKHYVQTKGVLVKAGESHSWLVRYNPISDSGKWNARVWADTVDDWSCIEDDKLSCEYSYTIDPSWDRNPSTYGTLAYYTFDNNVTSGTTLLDSHGKYNATLVNGVQSNQTGKINEAYLYDGSNDFVAVNSGGTISSFNGFSIWFKPNQTITTSANLQGILSRSNLSITTWVLGGSWSGSFSDEIVTISPDETGNKAYYWTATGLGIASFPSGQWQHMVVSWNSNDSNYRLYLNGTDKGLATQFGGPSQITSLTNLNIGRGYDLEFNGTIDELWLTNNTINDSEAYSLYNNGTGFQYPFNESVTPPAVYVTSNTSFPDGVYETTTNQFNISFEMNNGTNVSSVNVTYNNTLYAATYISSNSSEVNYAVNITAPLIEVNNTGRTFNISYYINFSNGTNTTNTSVNDEQLINWAFYPKNVLGDAEIFETGTYDYTVNISRYVTTSDVDFLATLQWNVTNQSTSSYSNDTDSSLFEFSVVTPLIDSPVTVLSSGYVNVTFDGTTFNRSLLDDLSQDIFLAYFPVNIIRSESVLESSTTTIIHNTTRLVNASDVSFTSTLQWNVTNYTNTTMTNDTDSMLFNHYVNVPAVDTNQTVDIFSWLTISFGASTVTRTNATIYTNQTVVSASFGECAIGEQAFLNFSIFNEGNDSEMIADLNGHFWVTPTSTNITEELNLSFSGATTYALCFVPSNETIKVTAQIEYSSLTEFATKTYYMTDVELTNTTTYVDLYLTPNSTQVALNVVDQDDNPVENATIYVLSYDLATDSYVTSEIVRTDFNGGAYAEMTLFTQFYRFMIFVNGELVLSSLETKVITTSLTFRINLEEDYFTNYNIVKGVSCNVSYDNTTSEFTYTFANSAGTPVNATLTVNLLTIYSETLVNSSSVNSSSGTITLGVGTVQNATYIAVGTITVDTEVFVCQSITIDFNEEYLRYGDTGIYLTFMLIMVLAMIGIWNPIAAVILGLLGLIMSVIFGFFTLPFGVLITIIFVGLAVIAVRARSG